MPHSSDAPRAACAATCLSLLHKGRQRLVVAESCTGGLISAALTAPPGASQVFICGLVSYANAAKERLLSIPRHLLEAQGAVSAEVACLMAAHALTTVDATIALSVTGIAGPSGATPTKPLGLAYFSIATTQGVVYKNHPRVCRFIPEFAPPSSSMVTISEILPGETRAERRRYGTWRALTLLEASLRLIDD